MKKLGFKFMGSTIVYAHMQATGMINDHLASCFRYEQLCAQADADPGLRAPRPAAL
jgi:DNA-3-methyladenine glycosylase I